MVNLGDQLNQLADEVDTGLMPDPAAIRRTGDSFRHRRHRRAGLTVAAAGLAAVLTVAAVLHLWERTDPEPAGKVRLQVFRTLSVPNAGAMIQTGGSLWVVDDEDRRLASSGDAPAGRMYQIDPETGDVRDQIPEAVGGWPSTGADAIWLSTAAGGLNVLTRVDPTTHEVTRIPISTPPRLPHGAAAARGALWVADHEASDVVRLDLPSGRVTDRIHFGLLVGAPNLPMTDDGTVWVSTDNGEVVGVDPTVGAIASQLQLPARSGGVQLVAKRGHVLYAASGNQLYEVRVRPHHRATLGRELALSQAQKGTPVAAASAGLGVLWVIQTDPDRLLRIDPATFKVTASMPIPGIDHSNLSSVALATTRRAVWVRVQDRLLEIRLTTQKP